MNIVFGDAATRGPPQYLADQLTLFQPGGGADTAHPLQLATPKGFHLPASLGVDIRNSKVDRYYYHGYK